MPDPTATATAEPASNGGDPAGAVDEPTPVEGWVSGPGFTAELTKDGKVSDRSRERVPGYGLGLLRLLRDAESDRWAAADVRLMREDGASRDVRIPVEALRGGE